MIPRSMWRMSPNTRIIVLSAVLVALLGLYVIGSLSISRMQRSAGADEPVIEEEVLSQTAEIRITRAGEQDVQTVLRRGEEGENEWRVRIKDAFYPADARRVEGFLEVLGELQSVRVAGSDREYHEQFEVSEGAAQIVELMDDSGAPIERLLAGKVAAGGGRLYLRKSDAERVLVVPDDLLAYLQRETSYWSDLRPLPRDLDAESIIRITVDGDLRVDTDTRMADRFTVYRNGVEGESAWSMDTGGGNVDERLDSDRVEAYAARLARVEASAFVVDPPQEVGLDRPAVSIRFESRLEREYAVEVGDRLGENEFYMRVSGPDVDRSEEGEPFLYTIDAEKLKPLLRNRDELMPEDE